jgi:chemotaxis protein methyltransferase CheR
MHSAELTDTHFDTIRRMVYQKAGIHLKSGKEALVRARLMKRLRALGMTSIPDYMRLIQSQEGSAEVGFMIDAMTTNKTSFFREATHFEFLRETVLPEIAHRHRLRFWSAACSSGEEPFTLAMVLRESLPDIHNKDALILATDISRRMLEAASRGCYSADRLRDMNRERLGRHFSRERGGCSYRVQPEIRNLVRFAYLNLMEKWPMKGPFQVLFCRNVMIYFDRPTQQDLVNRFWDMLGPGGYFFVGHSEGLSAIRHQFQYIKPAVYRKR